MEQFHLGGWKILHLFVAFLSVIRTLTKEIRVLPDQERDCPGAYHMNVLTTWWLWKKDSLDRAQIYESRRTFQTVGLKNDLQMLQKNIGLKCLLHLLSGLRNSLISVWTILHSTPSTYFSTYIESSVLS